MTRRKRRKPSKSKQHKPIPEPACQLDSMPTYHQTRTNLVWKKRAPSNGESWRAKASMGPILTSARPPFKTNEAFATWVFDVAKLRPVQLSLSRCERSEEVRDALLKQFHRWPETQLSRAAEKCQTLCQDAERQCQEQVALYLQELRGKFRNGASALFWLKELFPLSHSTSVPRQEIRETLLVFMEEVKCVNGVYDEVLKRSERIWAMLTLPLQLEPLMQAVCALAQLGHEAAAKEALALLVQCAEVWAEVPGRKSDQLPLGAAIVVTIDELLPTESCCLSELPETWRLEFAKPFAMMIRDWLVAVEEVLSILAKALAEQWAACERAPYEEELKDAAQDTLQSAFSRLSHALATDQLYAMRKERVVNAEACVSVNVMQEHGVLVAHVLDS